MSLASSATTALGRWPRRGVLLAVLVVSLALNVFFIAGAVWSRLEGPPAWGGFERRLQRLEAELDLDAQQRAAFERYVAAMRTQSDRMRQDVRPLYGAAWDEVAKPQPDRAEVLRLFDEATDRRREFHHQTMTQTLAFLATLSPEQRAKFVAIARERRGSRPDRRGKGG